jgi:hypothetical protein
VRMPCRLLPDPVARESRDGCAGLGPTPRLYGVRRAHYSTLDRTDAGPVLRAHCRTVAHTDYVAHALADRAPVR